MDKVTLLDDGQDADVHVTWEYQKKINRFSILNTLVAEMETELAELNGELEALEDSKGELQMTLDEEFLELELEEEEDAENDTTSHLIPVKIGSAFFMLSAQEASERIEQIYQHVDSQVNKEKGEIQKIKSEMSDLKKALYDRFGASIQLEQD